MELGCSSAEQDLWMALDMDGFGESLKAQDSQVQVNFGTGYTRNACFSNCDNSLSRCRAPAPEGFHRYKAAY